MTVHLLHDPGDDWPRYAACRGCDPDLWYPERYENAGHAKTVCATCPVQPHCLNHAIETNEAHGIWGGLNARERRNIRRDRRLTSPREKPFNHQLCGTVDGWRQHRNRKEPACPACRPHAQWRPRDTSTVTGL